MPTIRWDDDMVTILEGGDLRVCFTSDIGIAASYNVTVGVSQKGASPALESMDEHN